MRAVRVMIVLLGLSGPGLGRAQDCNGVVCDDGDACNGIETCANGSCVPGDIPNCDDNDPCTVDACRIVSGCTHDPLPQEQLPSCILYKLRTRCLAPPVCDLLSVLDVCSEELLSSGSTSCDLELLTRCIDDPTLPACGSLRLTTKRECLDAAGTRLSEARAAFLAAKRESKDAKKACKRLH